jgi:hypothetical protein
VPTTVNLRKMLDLKRWEMCAPHPTAGLAALHAASSTLFDQHQLWVFATGVGISAGLYAPLEDAWAFLVASGMTIGSTFAVSACYHPNGPTGTASAGAATTLTTALTMPGSLAGYTVRITGGTGAGQERVISANTYGANMVLTVSTPWTVTPDNTSTFLLVTGRFWVFCGASTAVMRYYDLATDTWSAALSVAGLTASSNEWRITATPAYGNTIATGVATGGTSTTLANTGKAWTTNQWANYQVRIVSGTGAGQVRAVTANTATTLTVAAWTTIVDATSNYVLEPNDDYLYAVVGGAVTLYRYSISGNTWSTLTPAVARSASPNAGGASLSWIGVVSDSSWADETNIKNGRYLYCFAAGGTGNYGVYDIAANTWINVTASEYRRGGAWQGPVFGGGVCVDREFIYVIPAGGPNPPYLLYRYNVVTRTLDPWSSWQLPGTGGYDRNGATIGTYTDGATTLRWLYHIPWATPSIMMRMLIF